MWGPEGLTEAEASLLGPVGDLVGRRVLEVGCGAAQCSRWLAGRGVTRRRRLDISLNQLRHARRGPAEPVVAGPRLALPFSTRPSTARSPPTAPSSSSPTSIAAGRGPARVLRPGGRWVFSVTHPIRWAFPDDPGPAGLSVSGSYFDRTPYVERDAAGSGGLRRVPSDDRRLRDRPGSARVPDRDDRRARMAGLERGHVGRLEPAARHASARHPDHRVPGRWRCWLRESDQEVLGVRCRLIERQARRPPCDRDPAGFRRPVRGRRGSSATSGTVEFSIPRRSEEDFVSSTVFWTASSVPVRRLPPPRPP